MQTLSINFPHPNPFLMRLSTRLRFAKLFAVLFLTVAFIHQAVAQSLTDNAEPDVFAKSFKESSTKAFKKFIGIHIIPTKVVAGELPVMLSMRVSPKWMVEIGAGPAFRDRVAEKVFDGKTLQLLSFENRNA